MGTKKKRLFFKLAITFLILALVWLLGSFTIGYIKGMLVKTTNIEYGILQEILPVEAYIIRKEVVINAPQKGELKPIVPEGDRVRLGSVVAEIVTPSLETVSGQVSSKITAPHAGLVSYQIDGLENLLTIENLEKLNSTELISTIKKYKPQEGVTKGKPIVKIVDNLVPMHFYIEVDEEKIQSDFIEEGKKININYLVDSSDKVEIKGKVISNKEEKDYRQLLIENLTSDKIFSDQRKIKLELVQNAYKGYIVSEDILVEKDGKPGIYIIYKKTVRWAEVEIIGQVDSRVVLDEEFNNKIHNNTFVVTNPSLVKEGQRLTN